MTLAELERLEKAATPGPWGTTRYSGGLTFNGPLRLYHGTNEEFGEPNPIRLEDEANIYFIAAARNALPKLIAEIRQLRAERQTGIGRTTWSTGDEETGTVTITESQRLEFLMQFFGVDDVGDESVCPGLVVDTDAVEDAFNCGALADETVTLMDGWHNPDMRRVIDKAIACAAIGPPPEPIKISNSVLESNILPLENLVLPASGPVIMPLITETDGASNQ